MSDKTSAARNATILTVAKGNSKVFTELFAQINQLLKDSGKYKKSSHAFGVALEAFHARKKEGKENRYVNVHRNKRTGAERYSWNLEALLTISDERAANNTHQHNKLRNELTKAKNKSSIRAPRKALTA